MKINGKEYGLMATLEAGIALSKICPGNDLNRIGELLEEDDYELAAENLFKIAEILNDGYVKAERHAGRTAERIRKDEIREYLLHSPLSLYNAAYTEVCTTVVRDLFGSVDAVDAPGTESKKDETGAEA